MRSTHRRLGMDRLRGELQSVFKKNDEIQKTIWEENNIIQIDYLIFGTQLPKMLNDFNKKFYYFKN